MEIEQHANRITITLASEAETQTLGAAIASECGPGRVIGLTGGLGAGKTRLCRAIAEAMGVDPGAIASPTFVLVHEYDGRLPVYHFDAYRLAGADDFDALGPDEYFGAGGVCLVEWADRVVDRLPADAWLVAIEPTGPDSRSVVIRGDDVAIGRIAGRLRSGRIP